MVLLHTNTATEAPPNMRSRLRLSPCAPTTASRLLCPDPSLPLSQPPPLLSEAHEAVSYLCCLSAAPWHGRTFPLTHEGGGKSSGDAGESVASSPHGHGEPENSREDETGPRPATAQTADVAEAHKTSGPSIFERFAAADSVHARPLHSSTPGPTRVSS